MLNLVIFLALAKPFPNIPTNKLQNPTASYDQHLHLKTLPTKKVILLKINFDNNNNNKYSHNSSDFL